MFLSAKNKAAGLSRGQVFAVRYKEQERGNRPALLGVIQTGSSEPSQGDDYDDSYGLLVVFTHGLFIIEYTAIVKH